MKKYQSNINHRMVLAVAFSFILAISFSLLPRSAEMQSELKSREKVNPIAANTPPPLHVPFDFDGDGTADLSVYRPSDGIWYLNRSNAGYTGVQFGLPDDKLVPADYDGDGKTEIAIFREGFWYILRSLDNTVEIFQFGSAEDTPLPVDYDGDDKADPSVFGQNGWYILKSSDREIFVSSMELMEGDRPFLADFDGDGITDFGAYRLSEGNWYIQESSGQGIRTVLFGVSDDVPVPADYDGDGTIDLAIYRSGTWHILGSSQGYTAHRFGLPTDIPVPADYDGDGKTDIAIFRDGFWWILQSSDGRVVVHQFGVAGDKPIPASFIP